MLEQLTGMGEYRTGCIAKDVTSLTMKLSTQCEITSDLCSQGLAQEEITADLRDVKGAKREEKYTHI